MRQFAEKMDGATASFATSAGVGVSASFVTGAGQWILFGIAFAIGGVRLTYEGVKLYRLLKNKKAL